MVTNHTGSTTTVAEVITSLMEAAGMSTLALAEETCIPRTTLQRRLKDPSGMTVKELDAIAAALGTTATSIATQATQAA